MIEHHGTFTSCAKRTWFKKKKQTNTYDYDRPEPWDWLLQRFPTHEPRTLVEDLSQESGNCDCSLGYEIFILYYKRRSNDNRTSTMGSKSRSYFSKIKGGIQWIRNPFEDDYLKKLKISSEQDPLVWLLRDQTLKSFFKNHTIGPVALRHLMGFSTTDLCERAYSTFYFFQK